VNGPHQDQPLLTAGTDLERASAAVVAVHGRGASARSVLQLTGPVSHPGVALLAPQAAGNAWYAGSSLAPVESTEPGRTSGLQAIADAVGLANAAGVPTERVAVFGFSQGACLVCEFAARIPTRYGGIVALSGGLLGETVDSGDYEGDLAGTPAFLGCGDADHSLPPARVRETAVALEGLDADVTSRVYDGLGHAVNDDELVRVSGIVAGLLP